MDKILNDLRQMIDWLDAKVYVDQIHIRQETMQDLWSAVETLRDVLNTIEEEEFE